jgi:hypothetical protein
MMDGEQSERGYSQFGKDCTIETVESSLALTKRRSLGFARDKLAAALHSATPQLSLSDFHFSNRYTARIEFAVTPSKQTTVVLSNRNKKPPPGGVATWLRPSPHSTVLPGTHMQTGIVVTHSKQTTMVLSSRYKKPPPGGVATWLPFRPALYLSNRNTPETGLAVTLSKQTTVVLSNRNKKPPPGGVPSWLAFRPALDPSLAARSVEASRELCVPSAVEGPARSVEG